MPPDMLDRLVAHFPVVEAILPSPKERAIHMQLLEGVRPAPTTAQQLVRCFLDNPGVAIGSKANGVTVSSNSYVIGTVLRRLVPRLAQGGFSSGETPLTYYGLLGEKSDGVRYFPTRFYVGLPPDAEKLQIGDWHEFPTFGSEGVRTFMVDKLYSGPATGPQLFETV